jgi:hypothetical protein
MFWKDAPEPVADGADGAPALGLPGGLAATAAALPLAALAAMTLASGPLASAMARTSAQLAEWPLYINAVLYPDTHAGDRLIRGGGTYEGEGGDGRTTGDGSEMDGADGTGATGETGGADVPAPGGGEGG